MDYNRQVQEIVNYFKHHEKKEENFKIGIEFEHFIIDEKNYTTISYYGEDGVEDTLKKLTLKGWQGIYEGKWLLGLTKEGTTITLEPGSQLELSIRPCKRIEEIEEAYLEFMADILPILKKKNQGLITTGYQPESKISDITMIPKERYGYMFDYFKSKGSYAHNMMKGTASVQLAIDYHSEEDYIKKFRIANGLSPVMYALFDNSPVFEGEIWEKYSLRTHIWENCDMDRCGVVDVVFDPSFGYESYAEYILNRAPILITKDNTVEFTGNKLFKYLFDPETYSVNELEHVLTMFFPDVRTKKFIEIRMIDAVPYPLNLAAVTLWKGILYDVNNLDQVYDFVKTLDIQEVNRAKEDIIHEGLDGKLMNKTIYEISKWLLDISKDGLAPEEMGYLRPLEDLLAKKKTLSQTIKEKLHLGKKEALSSCLLNNSKKEVRYNGCSDLN